MPTRGAKLFQSVALMRAQPAIPGDRNRAGLTHARAVFINVIQALQPLAIALS